MARRGTKDREGVAEGTDGRSSGNLLLAGLGNAYCVRAGETATIQLPYAPGESGFQMGFVLKVLLRRLDGLAGRRVV